MSKRFLFMLPGVLLFASLAFGQEVTPASSEDVNNFDKQLKKTEQKRERHRVRVHKEKKANFGQAVSTEAKALKEDGTKSKFGKTVSEKAKNKGKVKGMRNCAGDAACSADQGEQNKVMYQSRERKRVHSGSGSTSGPGTGSGDQGGNGAGGQGKGGKR